MAIWKPEIPVQSFMPLELNRGNPVRYIYRLPGNRVFPDDAAVVLKLVDPTNLVLGVWSATVTGGQALFSESAAVADLIPDGSAWTITAAMGADEPQLLMQGTVNRVEAPVFPATINPARALSFPYTFDTPGLYINADWSVTSGNPQVYNNSGDSLPNALACGIGFADVVMVHQAHLNSDAPRMEYTTVPHGDGDVWLLMSAGADPFAQQSAAIHHHKSGGTSTVGVTFFGAGSSGELATVAHAVANESFVAGYDPISRTYFVYAASDMDTPLTIRSDASGGTTVLGHDDGVRYFGMKFHSAGAAPGIEIANLTVSDGVTFS